MSRGKWDKAEEIMLKSLERAKDIPDYVYWLGSIARLSFIAAERNEDPQKALERLEAEFTAFKEKEKYLEENSLGITYIGLARLCLKNNDFDKALEYLKEGIPLVTEYGSYARTDVISRLTHFENDFDKIGSDGFQRLGAALADFVRIRVKEDRRYLQLLTFVNTWAKGKKAHGK
jgi:tetratricopeptide (TPR) repeat protein